jgi:SagB-type dehydrogenase family enzyme
MKLAISLACAVAVLLAAACTNTAEQATPHAFPKPALKGTMSLEEALATRRSVRAYADRPLSDEQLGQLLWAGQGITQTERGLRTAPSAGALYPIELYVFLGDGVYHYSPQDHALTLVKAGDQRAALAGAALGQGSVRTNGAVILIAADYARTTPRYGDRAKMYVDIEAGCVCQNVLLEAVALGLAGVPVGAFRDADVKAAAGLPEAETPILLIPVGHRAQE